MDPAVTGNFKLYKAGQGTESTVTNYKFDVWNQLIKTVTGQKTVTYSYNAEGYRVAKTENGQKTNYLYEGDKVILETDSAGNQTAKNVYGINLLTRTAGSDTMNYMYNGHGDVTALLKPDGTTAGTYYYDAFGNILSQTGTANNSITYAGYQYDKETDLYYLNARYYDSKIARFLSEDTYIGNASDPLSLNLYTYCHNEPVMYTDPTGHVYLKAGAKGDDVKVIQAALGVPATGVYDKKTEDAVNKYKTENKLGNTGVSKGVVGDQTYASIISGKVVSVKETKEMQAKAGTSSSANSYGLSSSTIAGTVGVSDSVSKKVSDAVVRGAPDDLDVTIGKSIVTNAKPTNVVNNTQLSWNDKIMSEIKDTPAYTWFVDQTRESGLPWAFGFYRDENGNYHARQDASVQSFKYAGYNDLYDKAFDLATSMDKAKFQFTYNKKEYIFWAWKGDYLNLGAGAEMGIYSEMVVNGVETDHWLVDKSLAMPMTLKLEYNGYEIISYDPKKDDPQGKNTKKWWVTGFNPYYQDIQASELKATYTVNFSGKEGMYDAFIKSDDYLKNKSKWSVSKDNQYILTLIF